MGDFELKTPSISACAPAPHVSPARIPAKRRAHGPHQVPRSGAPSPALAHTRPTVERRTKKCIRNVAGPLPRLSFSCKKGQIVRVI